MSSMIAVELLQENMYSLHVKVMEARKSLIQEGHQHPSPEELAVRVGITTNKLHNMLRLMRNPLSMQQSIWTDQDITFQVRNSFRVFSKHIVFYKTVLV